MPRRRSLSSVTRLHTSVLPFSSIFRSPVTGSFFFRAARSFSSSSIFAREAFSRTRRFRSESCRPHIGSNMPSSRRTRYTVPCDGQMSSRPGSTSSSVVMASSAVPAS